MVAVVSGCPAQAWKLAELREVPGLIARKVVQAAVIHDSSLLGGDAHMAMRTFNGQLTHTPNVESPPLNGNTATDLTGESIQQAMYGHPP